MSKETTPFWKEEINAHGDIDKCERSVIAIFFIGYGKDGQGYFVIDGFSKFIVVSIDSFFVFTCSFIVTGGKLSFDINTLLLISL